MKKTLAIILMVSQPIISFAHTNSIGYTNNGGGSATFWYGNWHPGTTFNEGSIQLLGINGVTYNQTQAFSLLSGTTPTGLDPNATYFTSNATQLVFYSTGLQTSSTWQGATFTGLTAGTYQFTYIPLAAGVSNSLGGTGPTANWQPMDSVILSSTITLTDAFFHSGSLVDLNPNAYGLRGAFNMQSAIANNGLNYDCTTFDAKGICVSAGGRYTNVDSPSLNTLGALLIASYRFNDNLRVGGYLDQNMSTNNTSGIHLSNSMPATGIFAVWNQNTDGTGFETRLAASYSDKDVRITRDSGLNTEAGSGESSIVTKAVSATVAYGKKLGDGQWIASPYLGLRYSKIERNSYTEDNSISNPLTYSDLADEKTTALVGMRLNGNTSERVNLTAMIGLEQDLTNRVGQYAAEGIDPLAFNSNIKHTRPVASAGLNYAIDYRQTLAASISWRQEAFQSSSAATGMVTYQVGF